MQLYVIPRCPFGHRAAFAIAQKQLPAQIVFFDRTRRPSALDAVGPRAKSPTLIDGDTAVHDSLVVLEYLEDRYPERPLLPATGAGRAAVRMQVTCIQEELAPKFGAVIAEALFTANPDPAKLEASKRAFLDALAPWDRHLQDREYVAESMFSLADITLYTMFPAIRRVTGVEVPEDRPHLRAWLERMAARAGAEPPAPPT